MMSDDVLRDKMLSVKIGGETVRVIADEGPEYILRMANYINYIIDEWSAKKGHSLRQTVPLVYVALELCNTLFTERDNKTTALERSYEKMYQMELFSHKKTQDTLEATRKKLDDTERQLLAAKKELEDFVNAFDEHETKAQTASPKR